MKKLILPLGLAAFALGSAAFAADPPPHAHESADLKTIMVGLGEDMAKLNMGLWLEDFGAVTTAATAIADHPHVSADERQRLQAILGKDFGSFAAADGAVHDQAVNLAKAATAKDLDLTVQRLAELQTGCVSCHTGFRARLAK